MIKRGRKRIETLGRADPFERAMKESDMYLRWYSDKMWTFVPAQAITARFLGTFKPRFPR